MAKETKKQLIYEVLKDKIIRCELKPGSFVTEEELSQLTGSSRTPIREALQKLEEDELVRIGSKKGIEILPITAKQIRNYFDVRKLVEPHCILNYANRISLDDVQGMLEALKECKDAQDTVKGEELDHALHMIIIRASDNDYLIKMMEKIFLYGDRIRYYSKTAVNYASPAIDQHIRIYENILFGEYEKAAAEMLNHIKSTEVVSYSLVYGKTVSMGELDAKVQASKN